MNAAKAMANSRSALVMLALQHDSTGPVLRFHAKVLSQGAFPRGLAPRLGSRSIFRRADDGIMEVVHLPVVAPATTAA